MIIEGHKGLTKLRIKIHKMSNQKLLIEWQNIRCLNDKCKPLNMIECYTCNYTNCQKYLRYEEIITDELVTRGLFEFALNKFHKRNAKLLSHEMISSSGCHSILLLG
ncbi:MAG: hypothetical protein ACTSSH_14335 [Candidatus Heimdallarchaeota archaeon]